MLYVFEIVRLSYCPLIDWTLYLIGNHGKYEKNPISVPRKQKVTFSMHRLCCGTVKGLRQHPFGSVQLEELSTFD